MTSSDALNSQLFRIRDDQGVDIQKQVFQQLNSSIDGSLFSYLQKINRADSICYAVCGVIIVLIWKRLDVSFNTLIGIAIAMIVVYLYNEKQSHTVADANRDLMTELETLDNLTGQKHIYLYLEPELIRFWADNVDFRQYAKDAFDRSLKMADLFMNLYYDIQNGVEQCSADIDVAEDLRRKILNTWNEISFNLPDSQLIRDKHAATLDKLLLIILKLLAETKSHCKQRPLSDFRLTPPVSGTLEHITDNYVLF